jgi:UDP-glucose 4-epimerase
LGRVLVTGGAGTVGSTIVDHAVRAGATEVVVFDTLDRGRPENLAWAMAHGRVTLVPGDICDPDAVRRVTEGADVVFHQAALRITRCAGEPRLAHDVMATGTLNVAEAAVDAGVRKVLLASSASVYGMADVFPTPETHAPYGNRTVYGALKAYDESLLRSFHDMYGLDYVALRYFNVYGPRMAVAGPHTEVMVRWMERIASGEPPLILGDGSQTMDFVDVDDVAAANILAACSPVTDDVFNVGTGVETSLLDLAAILCRVMGADLGPVFGPERITNPVPQRVADTAHARDGLGFEARTHLEEGLVRLVQWWRVETGRAHDGVDDHVQVAS